MPLDSSSGAGQNNPVGFPITNAVIVFSLILVLMTYLMRPSYFPIKWSRSTKIMLAAIFFLTAAQLESVFGAFDFDSTIRLTITIASMGLQTLLFFVLVKDETVLRRVFTFFLILAVAISILNVLTAFQIIPPILERLSASRELGNYKVPFKGAAVLFGGRGTYGIFMHGILPMALLALMKGPTRFANWRRIYTVPAVIAILAGLVVTQSRSAWLGTLFILFFMSLFYLNNMRISRKIIFAVGVAATLFLYLLLASNFVTDVRDMSAETVSGRIGGYVLAVKSFGDNPVFGMGDSNPYFIAAQGHELHNTYLTVLVDNGLVGFIPFMMIFFMTFKRLMKILGRSIDYDHRFLAVSLFGSFIGLSTEASFYQGYFVKNFWMVLALILISLNFIEAGRLPDKRRIGRFEADGTQDGAMLRHGSAGGA